jgi:hypothetical protein
MSDPKELKAEAEELYAKAREVESLDERLNIILRALELEMKADVTARHERAVA